MIAELYISNYKNYYISNYRFGFNGKENDNEVKGVGNQQDYGFRIYDPRIGKFLSVDPLTKSYPWYTPYQFAGNSPILNIDLDGLENLDYKKFLEGMIDGETKLNKIDFPKVGRQIESTSDIWVEDEHNKIILNNNYTPSQGIKDFAKNPQNYNMDCAAYSQAIILYGVYLCLGAEEFNTFIKNEMVNDKFVLSTSANETTGISCCKDNWVNKGNGIMMNESGQEKKSSKVINKSKIGTTINLQSNFLNGTNYFRENIVKVGDDRFVAQGFEGILTLDQIKDELINVAIDEFKANGSRDEMKASIFVNQVNEYGTNIEN